MNLPTFGKISCSTESTRRGSDQATLIWILICLISSWGVLGEDRPNIIFFFADDQSYDSLGCYGNPDVQTPHIDQLGREGLIFNRHYNTTAICMASRANVMTGLLEYRTGCNFMHGPMLRKTWEESYPVRLRQEGYLTAFGGKFGFAVVDDLTRGGSENRYEDLPIADFDAWFGGAGQTSYETAKNPYLQAYADRYPHSTRAYGAAGVDFIKRAAKSEKPFCLSLFFKAPHRPVTPDPTLDGVYQGTYFRKLPNYGREAGHHLAPQHRLGRQYARFETWGYHQEQSYQQAMRQYHQQIHAIDVAVGMIREALVEQGVADRTVLIYSSDNGFFNGSHGLGSKVLPYEEGSRVPLLILDPRMPANCRGREVASVTGNIDIAATILDLAGMNPSLDLDGRSLRPILRGSKSSVRETLPLIQVWGTAGTLALGVVTTHYKYVYWPYGEGMSPSEELFDMEFDPYEMRNLLSMDPDHPVLRTMRNHHDMILDHWREKGVGYHDYPVFAEVFDRTLSWPDKKKLVPRTFFSAP
jgi:arylsulfatase A-like enzyme